jgi:hypothetical protein
MTSSGSILFSEDRSKFSLVLFRELAPLFHVKHVSLSTEKKIWESLNQTISTSLIVSRWSLDCWLSQRYRTNFQLNETD